MLKGEGCYLICSLEGNLQFLNDNDNFWVTRKLSLAKYFWNDWTQDTLKHQIMAGLQFKICCIYTKQVAKNSVPGYLPCKFTQRWCVRPFWGLHGCMNLCPNLLQTSQFWLWLRCSVYQVIEYLRVGDLWKSNSDVPFLWLKSKICNRRFFLPSALRFKLHGVVLL